MDSHPDLNFQLCAELKQEGDGKDAGEKEAQFASTAGEVILQLVTPKREKVERIGNESKLEDQQGGFETPENAFGDSQTTVTSSPDSTPVSAFELRRNANMEQNESIINSISPLVISPSKTRRARQQSEGRGTITPRQSLHRSAKVKPIKPIKHMKPPKEKKSPSTSPPAKVERRTVTTDEVKLDANIAEFPPGFEEFYILGCLECPETFKSVTSLCNHLKKSNHRRGFPTRVTQITAVRMCGIKVHDATTEWLAHRKAELLLARKEEAKEKKFKALTPEAASSWAADESGYNLIKEDILLMREVFANRENNLWPEGFNPFYNFRVLLQE